MELAITQKDIISAWRRYRLLLAGLVFVAIFLPCLGSGFILNQLLFKPALMHYFASVRADFALDYFNYDIVSTLAILGVSILLAYLGYVILLLSRSEQGSEVLFNIAKNLESKSLEEAFNPRLLSYAEEIAGYLGNILLHLKENLINYQQNLITKAKETEKLHAELKLARSIQQEMLPQKVNLPSCYSHIELQASLAPASDIAGDFYDYQYLGDGILYFAIGDVCGNGIPASMTMTKVLVLLRSHVQRHFELYGENVSPEEILYILNRQLCQNNDKALFITMILGIVDLRVQQCRYANAGHNYPYFIKNGKVSMPEKAKGSKPLGVMEKVKYVEEHVELTAGSGFFLYTDGMVEARNIKGQVFKPHDLEIALQGRTHLEAFQMLCTLQELVLEFVGQENTHDDITMLYIRNPEQTDAAQASEDVALGELLAEYQVEVQVPDTKISDVQRGVQGFLNSFAELAALKNRPLLLLEEVLVNTVTYGFKDNPGCIHIQLQRYENILLMMFKDNSPPFDPTNVSLEALSSRRRQLDNEEGGRGLLLLNKITDKLSYNYIDGYNILTAMFHY